MNFEQFRDKLIEKYVSSGRQLKPEFKGFRLKFLKCLIGEFESTGRLNGQIGQWPKIFDELSSHSDKYKGKIDSAEFRKSLRQDEGHKEKIFVLYFGLHTFKRTRINPDTQEVEYPYKNIAYQLDKDAFGEVQQIDFIVEKIKVGDDEPFDEENTTSDSIINNMLFSEDFETGKIDRPIRKNNFGFVIEEMRGNYSIKMGVAKDELTIPKAKKLNIRDSFLLVDWQQSLVGLSGRELDLDKLHSWLGDETTNKSIMLMHGSGGVGKTRLAFHFANEAKAKGWEAGRVNCSNFIGSWRAGHEGLLLIIDYVEERYESIKGLLKALESFDEIDKSKMKLRILVLSRNKDFAKGLTRDANRRVHIHHLKALEKKEHAWEVFDDAWEILNALGMSEKYLDKKEYEPSLPNFYKWLKKS